MWEIILDVLLESAITIPFLFVVHLLIELLEHNDKAKLNTVRLLNGKCAPLVASAVAVVPQCGFSVMATDLYCQSYLKLGTLIAFFIATSDEALPILLANVVNVGGRGVLTIVTVLLCKVVFAVAVGYFINALDKRQLAVSYTLNDDKGCCHHDVNEHESGLWHTIKHPLLHTLKIFVYIFVISSIFSLLADRFNNQIVSFCNDLGIWQVFITSLLGLVPSCASSVLITEMFVDGIIGLPALLSGLVANSGIALIVLFKNKKEIKRNLLIVAILYLSGVTLGLISSIF